MTLNTLISTAPDAYSTPEEAISTVVDVPCTPITIVSTVATVPYPPITTDSTVVAVLHTPVSTVSTVTTVLSSANAVYSTPFMDSVKSDDLSLIFETAEISPVFQLVEISPEPSPIAASSDSVSPKDAQRIRVHLSIGHKDLGLELLYEELSRQADNSGRVRFLKKRIHELLAGSSAPTLETCGLGENLIAGTFLRKPTFTLVFQMSPSEIWLGKLYAALAKLASPMARNVHVKRFLFEAYNKPASGSGTLPVPSLPALISLTSPVPLPLSSNSEVMSPWSNPAQLPVKRSEEEHQLKVKQRNAANLKSFGYKPECVLTKSPTLNFL